MGKDTCDKMMKFPNKIYCAVISIFLSLNVIAQNTSSIGGLAGSAMRMGFSARGIALGNSMTAITKDELSTYYNPALSPFNAIPTIDIAYSILSFDRKLNFLSYTKSLKPDAGFSIAIINSGVANIDGRNRDGVHTEFYSTSENAFLFNFALKLLTKLSIGINTKIFYYYLFEDMKSTTVGFDVGAVYLLTDEISVGIVVQDIKSRYHWNSSKLYGKLGKDFYDNFPIRKRVGVAFMPQEYPIVLSCEFEALESEKIIKFGSEVEIIDGIRLRGGIDQLSFASDLPIKPSIGFALESTSINWLPLFQYTYVIEPYSTNGIHILSLAYKFK